METCALGYTQALLVCAVMNKTLGRVRAVMGETSLTKVPQPSPGISPVDTDISALRGHVSRRWIAKGRS